MRPSRFLKRSETLYPNSVRPFFFALILLEYSTMYTTNSSRQNIKLSASTLTTILSITSTSQDTFYSFMNAKIEKSAY